MNSFTKETLEEQLRILSERSMTAQDAYVAPITAQMIRLAQLIDPELRSQSYAEALSPLPAAKLSKTGLEELWNIPPAEVLDELLGNPKPRD